MFTLQTHELQALCKLAQPC